jgi:hypothetical protein
MKLKDKIIKNRVGILIFIGVLLVVTIIIGISYAYFFNIEIKNNNTISGNINTKYYTFESSGNSTLSLTINQSDLDMANASNDYSSFVSGNGGNINVSLNTNGLKKVYCSYDLVYIPSIAYTPSSGATNAGLKEFTLSGTSDKGNSFSEIDVSGSSAVTLISGIKISTDTNILEKWSFTAKYYNLDVIQDNVVGKTFKGNIKVANTNCSFNEQSIPSGDYVLLKSTGASSVAEAKSQIESKTKPDFSTVTTASDKGMYSAKDDLGTSYYFRGAVDNNWVKYGKYTKDMYNCNNGTISATDTGNSCTKIASSGDDIYWRIIRINGDGSIRMIYSGVKAPTESTKVIKTEDTSLGVTVFNANTDSSEYVGYMYTLGQQHGTSKSSDIKTYLDNWYANYTDLNKTGTKITDQIYCNDRTASTSNVAYSTTNYTTLTSWNSKGTTYYYGANGRVWNNPVSPDYKCPVASDKFTTTTVKGNGKLSYPVGLISADEITFAGIREETPNNSFYLYTGADYWAGSPIAFFDGDIAYGFFVGGDGALNIDYVNYTYGVRGVVSLSSEANLIGDGTWNNVYEVASDKPTVKNISISGKNVTATLSGEKGLTGYAISKSTSTPKNWVSISGKSYNLNTNVQEEGRNYLWVKDAKGNTTTQEIVVLLGTSFDTIFVANNNDLFNHNGIRYEGANPNNYICLDNNTTGSCSNKNLLFRIIGLFEEELTGSSIMNNSRSKLLKIISTTNYGTSRWAASSLSSNDYNLNNWEQSDIATTLNNNYIGNLFNISEFHSKFANQRNGLAQAKWHLGGANSSTYNWEQVTAADMYAIERNTSAVYSSNPPYLFGYVGLMYPSDYGYAAKGCQSTKLSELHNNQTCLDNNWLYQSQLDTFNNILDEWLISPSSANANNVSIIRKGYVQASGIDSTDEYNYRPVFYLDSKELSIAGGEGTSTNPYHIR